MKEIIYIQAGNYANYIGTHFWNTQESYFDFEEVTEGSTETLVDHDVSFRQGISTDGRTETFCPRLLIFDRKDQFGTLSRCNALYYDAEAEDDNNVTDPTLEVVQQATIERSEYQKHLDLETEDEHSCGVLSDNTPPEQLIHKPESIRYWSDYNRVFYLPRSLHAVSQSQTQGAAERAELVNTVTEDSFRRFAEECDLLQGIVSTLDSTTFGQFSVSLLEHIRDDFPKSPVVSVLCLDRMTTKTVSVDDTLRALEVVVDGSVMGQLLSWSHTLTTPVQSPGLVMPDYTSHPLSLDVESKFQTSSILSCHLESVTFPLRARQNTVDLNSFCSHLNWGNDTPLANLFGSMPVRQSDIEKGLISLCDFSSWNTTSNTGTDLARRIVTRGLFSAGIDDQLTKLLSPGLSWPLVNLHNFMAYPIPSSFPRFFGRSNDPVTPTRAIQCVSSLATKSHMYQPLLQLADFVNSFAKRGRLDSEAVAETFGGGREELKELSESLRHIAENWGGGWDDENEEFDHE